MDWNQVEGNWKEFQGKVKEKWASLLTTISLQSMANAIS